MDFHSYDNDQNNRRDSPPSGDLWNIPADNGNMDNHEEYFTWTDDLKIDDDKLMDASTTFVDSEAQPRKRKVSSSVMNDSPKQSKITYKSLKALEPADKQENAKRNSPQNGTSRMPPWQVEDISDLNADLEGSLTGLGGDLSNGSYNMSDAILSLPCLPVFKQEAPSPSSSGDAVALQQLKQNQQNGNCPQVNIVHPATTIANNDVTNNQVFNSSLQHLLGTATYSNLQNAIDGADMGSPASLSPDGYNVTSSSSFSEDCRFQYVLAAATSIATKINEDTLTYLNQGQSYEIKLKKLGDLSHSRGKMLKSIIKICFHERRLQYMEREQMSIWQRSRPGDRILEVDVPLSYGLCDVSQPNNILNTVHFNWDPTKEVGVYIKVNCISTEFTPKKHGGEKGVPFRIQVETYQVSEWNDPSKRLHAAACQIKVFKLKGADRKHKQDREKILKRPIVEQEKYQRSYDCTVLNDIPFDAIVASSLGEVPLMTNADPYSPESRNSQNCSPQLPLQKIEESSLPKFAQPTQTSPLPNIEPSFQNIDTTINHTKNYSPDQLPDDANPQLTIQWLTENRFEKYLATFANFSGSDMLRMSRDDLIQICGQADGIRLYNALHSKTIAPKLTIYICRDNSTIFNAIFLSSYNNAELVQKLVAITGVAQEEIRDIYMQGPQSIHIQLNSDVVRHIKEESMFSLEIVRDNGNYLFILKPIAK